MKITIDKTLWKEISSDLQQIQTFLEQQFLSLAQNEGISKLSPDQITLYAFLTLRQEMSEGGLLQLLYNGYGPFIFENPFAKAMRLWGFKDFSKFIYSMRELYDKYHQELESMDVNDDEFMALYEQYPEMEDADDEFIETEPRVFKEIATFVMKNIHCFEIEAC